MKIYLYYYVLMTDLKDSAALKSSPRSSCSWPTTARPPS